VLQHLYPKVHKLRREGEKRWEMASRVWQGRRLKELWQGKKVLNKPPGGTKLINRVVLCFKKYKKRS